MPLMQKVLSRASEQWITCCWGAISHDCDRPGYELHKVVMHEHLRSVPCSRGEHVTFVFCSENHKMLFVHSHHDLWNLPPGYRKIR